MKIVRNFKNISEKDQNSVLTLGNFDGIHLGHQEILNNVRRIAKNQGLKSALLTFEPHPLKVINPAKATNIRLLTLSQKLQVIQENSLLDLIFLVNFNQQIANLEAEDFVKNILVDKLRIKHLVIGYDFVFGKNKKGNSELLEKLSKKYNFAFTKIGASKDSNQKTYSSTNIRRFIYDGKIESANLMLGRNYQVKGTVIKGKQLGKTIGFPTANIMPRAHIITPKFGVYKAIVKLANKESYKAVVNFGIRPTFDDTQPIFEAHIFDFNKDIYDQKLTIELLEFIREEKKFSSKEELIKQINKDCQIAKN